MAKTIAGTYIYSKYNDYEKKIFEFAMNGEIINKKTEDFEDIAYDVKRRQVSNALYKILMSEKVYLILPEKRLPKPFKINCIKDIRHGKSNDKKIFIDCFDIFSKNKEGKLKCSNIDMLIAYLVSAMVSYIYYIDSKVIMNSSIVASEGATCFAKLLTHVVDYLCKISTVEGARSSCMYLSAMYYLCNIMEKDPNSDSTKNLALRIAEISTREADIIEMQVTEDTFVNIKTFIESLANVLKLNKLTFDVVAEKWMYLYGEGTIFALEHFPSFTSLLTDAYVGCYINNQKTIEKVAGKDMVQFAKEILSIGSEAV